MGYDLYGCEPTHKNGEYFRNNIWSWPPLWEYISENCNDVLTDHEIEVGMHNNNYLITKAKAMKIASKLRSLVDDGETQEFSDYRKRMLDNLLDEQCDICHGSGTRYQKPNPNYQERDKSEPIRTMTVGSIAEAMKLMEKLSKYVIADPDDEGAQITKCNGCRGKGTIRPFQCKYPFSVENVQEFIGFCEASGGFKIC